MSSLPRPAPGRRDAWHLVAAVAIVAAGAALHGCPGPSPEPGPAREPAPPPLEPVGRTDVEFTSRFSRIVVRQTGAIRTLLFVRDDGHEATQSRMDVHQPARLVVPYTRSMFASHLFVPAPRKVLIVGLGGGSMVRFLRRHDPEVEVEAIDIDPVVVDIARRWFGTRDDARAKLLVADGFDFLATTPARYDVIYMDAFLKPSMITDETGVPLRLKTVAFFRQLQERLAPGGVVVFNVNEHDAVDDDLSALREAFGQTYVLRVPPATGNLVVVGTPARERAARATLEAAGAKADARLQADFSIARLVDQLDPS